MRRQFSFTPRFISLSLNKLLLLCVVRCWVLSMWYDGVRKTFDRVELLDLAFSNALCDRDANY